MYHGIPSASAHFNTRKMGSQESVPRLGKKGLSLIPAACQGSSKPQLPFLGKWEEAKKNHIPEGTFTSTRGNKRTRNLKRNLLQATLEVQKLGYWNSGRGFQADMPPFLSCLNSVLAIGKHHDLSVSRIGARSPVGHMSEKTG